MIPYRSAHFIGVLTPEMASLAAYCVQMGLHVTSSDDHRDTVYLPCLIKAGVTFFDTFSQNNVAKGVELVILSRYWDKKHVEADAAVRLNIPLMSDVQFMKLITESKHRIAILGDYQARLSAALLSHVWRQAHYPAQALTMSVPLDSAEPALASYNDSEPFILPFSGFKRDATTYEADFLAFEAPTILIPAIMYDYPELNTTLDDVYQSYYTFVKRVPRTGLVIGNGDYPRMKRLRSHLVDRHIETFGFDRDVMWQIRDVEWNAENAKTEFSLLHGHNLYGPFSIPYQGEILLYTAVGVTVLSLLQEMKPDVINRGLSTAPQLRRIMETHHDAEGRIIIDDQADHPELITSVLTTIKAAYPQKKIWCLYQPGSYLRTKALMKELEEALSLADFIYLTDIKGYPKEKSEGVNIRYLVSEMKRSHPQTYYFDATTDTSGLLADRVASTDCIVALGTEGLCQQIVQTLLIRETASS